MTTRRIISFGVQVGDVDGVGLCRMFNEAIAGEDVPRHLSSDNDPLFEFYRWNEQRTHTSLDGNTPIERTDRARANPINIDNFKWKPHCRGLFELPVAA